MMQQFTLLLHLQSKSSLPSTRIDFDEKRVFISEPEHHNAFKTKVNKNCSAIFQIGNFYIIFFLYSQWFTILYSCLLTCDLVCLWFDKERNININKFHPSQYKIKRNTLFPIYCPFPFLHRAPEKERHIQQEQQINFAWGPGVVASVMLWPFYASQALKSMNF